MLNIHLLYIDVKIPVKLSFTDFLTGIFCILPVNFLRFARQATTGDTDAPENYKNIFLEEAEKYCRKIFDALYRCEYDPDFMKLYVCGGGVQLIRRFGKYNSDRVIFIDDICATAKGYQQFALKTLKSLEKRSE